MRDSRVRGMSRCVPGLLAGTGPKTPYELKQLVAESIGHFWTFPHSQLYSEPARLATGGFVEEEREEGGRRRRRFAIAEPGKTALREWLAAVGAEFPEVRDPALLKLFFGPLTAPGNIVALARRHRDAHRKLLEQFTAAAEPLRGTAAAIVRFGIAFEQASVEFWQSIAADPPAGPHIDSQRSVPVGYLVGALAMWDTVTTACHITVPPDRARTRNRR
ncbi:helix-turn-helix transcriptional regulator [Nocardia sp. NPDC052112]|uniref:PadR family transcriptional regulator n=1 Tax=Nocardia sp. NPDC052112 TaxID=3155646 RepID=UPI0034331734